MNLNTFKNFHWILLIALILMQGCTYLDTVDRYQQSQEDKHTDARYSNKCLIADECALVYGDIYLKAPYLDSMPSLLSHCMKIRTVHG